MGGGEMALALSQQEKCEIVADRISGIGYRDLALKYHVSQTTARKICAEMGLKTGKIRRMEYDPRKTQRDFEQP